MSEPDRLERQPNLLLDPSELADLGWIGCDHLDCMDGCAVSEFHCVRLAGFLSAMPEKANQSVFAIDHPDWPWNCPS